jgi:hypothetical protein
MMENRPKGILIISIIWVFAGILAFSILGISLIFPGTHLLQLLSTSNNLPPSLSNGMLVILVLVLGLIVLFTGWGLFKGQKWAWWLTVMIFIFGGITDAVKAVSDSIEGILGVLIAAGVIYYLTRPGVLKFFNFKSKTN